MERWAQGSQRQGLSGGWVQGTPWAGEQSCAGLGSRGGSPRPWPSSGPGLFLAQSRLAEAAVDESV